MPTPQEILAENRKALEAQNAAAMERTDSVQPTPTQEEIDVAKLATPTLETLDGKEDHGAPEERQVEAGGQAEYRTRAARGGRSRQSSAE
jgi:hypothetical protein